MGRVSPVGGYERRGSRSRLTHVWRRVRAAEGATLEMLCGASHRGFKSHRLRPWNPGIVEIPGFSLCLQRKVPVSPWCWNGVYGLESADIVPPFVVTRLLPGLREVGRYNADLQPLREPHVMSPASDAAAPLQEKGCPRPRVSASTRLLFILGCGRVGFVDFVGFADSVASLWDLCPTTMFANLLTTGATFAGKDNASWKGQR